MTGLLLTYPEAARLAGVSLATIRRRVADGTLPHVRTAIPRRCYVPRHALEALLRPGTVRPSAGASVSDLQGDDPC